MKIDERQIIKQLNFTEAQKAVLSKIINSQNPKAAGSAITSDRKMIVARDFLIRLGIINHDPATGAISITNGGQLAMIDAGLTDESGRLTDVGNKYANVGSSSPQNNQDVKQSFESFDLLREINNLANKR